MASDPAYLRAFKEFAKGKPTVADQAAMEKEFYGQNDRACGILHASWVELALTAAIKIFLKPDAPSALFDFNGPLGSFASKIMMAHGLGLFGSNTNHDLGLIRTIRNEFAHCQLPLRFDIPAVKAVCDHLMLPDIEGVRATPTYFWSLPDEKPATWYDENHPKTRFVIACYTIIHALLNLQLNMKRQEFNLPLP
jgi:hypothetical protein